MASPGRDSAAAPTAEQTLETLIAAVQDLSQVRTMEDLQNVTRSAARRLVNADGATFILRDRDRCFYADEDAISPLWKGQRFAMEACISGWSMLNRRAAVIEDIYADERIPHEAYRPTFVKSLAMVPIRADDPIGAIGVYWAHRHRASEREVGAARALADSTAIAIEHLGALGRLEQTLELMETDPLTGLANRRAWDEVLRGALHARTDPICLLMLDLDGFKDYNDTHGHQGGDRLLREASAAWRRALRGDDVIARYGGDEFAVLMPDCDAELGAHVAERLREATPEATTVSIGVAQWNGERDAELVSRADQALYAAKGLGRDSVVIAD